MLLLLSPISGICINIYVCAQVWLYVCVLYIYVDMYTYVCVCMYIRVWICICEYNHMYTYMYIYTLEAWMLTHLPPLRNSDMSICFMYMCIYTYVNLYVYIYTFFLTPVYVIYVMYTSCWWCLYFWGPCCRHVCCYWKIPEFEYQYTCIYIYSRCWSPSAYVLLIHVCVRISVRISLIGTLLQSVETDTCACIHVRTYVRTCVYRYICLNIHICIHACLCVFICKYIHKCV